MARNAIVATSDAAAASAVVEALRAAGFRPYAAARTGMLLARAGVMLAPIDMLSGQRVMLGGRVEMLQARLFAGIVGRRDDVSEAEQLARDKVHAIDVVAVQLPMQPKDLSPELEPEDAAGAAEHLRRGPYIAEAALLEAAILHHAVTLPVVDFAHAADAIRAHGHDTLDEAARRELVRRAHVHLAAFRRFVAWALDFEAADAPAVPAPHRSPSAGHRIESGAHRPASGGYAPEDETALAPASRRHASGAHETDLFDDMPNRTLTAAPRMRAHVGPVLELPDPLPDAARTRIVGPDALGAAFALRDLEGVEVPAWVVTDTAAAFEALRALGEPGVATARAAMPCAVVRLQRTATRAILRAVGVDPRAVQHGVLLAGCELDLTAARVIAESEPLAPLQHVVAAGFQEEASALLTERGKRCIVLEVRAPAPSHRLGSDAFGPFVASIADDRLARCEQAGDWADAARLGISALPGLDGHGAAVVSGEGTLAVSGGQPHLADAMQIAVGKSRKHAAGAVLVVTGTVRDLALVELVQRAGIVAVVEFGNADVSDGKGTTEIDAAAKRAGIAWTRLPPAPRSND
ncbi:MAG: Bifunctional purine biosynthesis protein PurH [Pseudomonadota bacterium]